MFNTYTEVEVNRLWHALGTFYNYLDSNSKGYIETIWKALFDGVEGLYYNLSQSSLSNRLDLSLGYIEHTFEEWTVTKSLLTSERLDAPTISGASSSPSVDNEYYSYAVTAVDTFGETGISNPLIIISGASDLLATPNNLYWNLISGASSYNVYGRTPGSLYLIEDSIETNYYVDSGISVQSDIPPVENTTIQSYLYDIPSSDKFVTIPTLSGLYTENILTEGTDYEIYNLEQIRFFNPEDLEDVEVYFTNQALSILQVLLNVYLVALGEENDLNNVFNEYSYQPYISGWSSLTYTNQRKIWIQHFTNLMHAIFTRLIKGPTMKNLKESLDLFYNLPFSYESGEVIEIVSGISYNYITIQNSNAVNTIYEIPVDLNLLYEEGDSVNTLDILCSGVNLYDYINNPTRIETLTSGDSYTASEYHTMEINVPTELTVFGYYLPFINYFKSIVPPGITAIYT